MKKTILLITLIFTVSFGFSQQYLISNYNGQTVNTCSGRAYDSGGGTAAYGNNQNLTMTICSNNTSTTHIKLYFWDFDIDPTDTLYIYDGNSTAAPLLGAYNNTNSLYFFPVYATANNGSGCLTLKFKSNGATTGAGWDAEISCIKACQIVLSAIDSAASSPHLADSGYLDICLGDTITFVGKGIFPQNNIIYNQSNTNCTFIWNFGDGTIDTGLVLSHLYTNFMGYNVKLTIIDSMGCQNMNDLGLRVRISKSPINHIASLPDICSNTDLSVNVGPSSISTINISTPYFYQTASLEYDSATFIPDGGAMGGQCYNTNVVFNCFNPGQTVTAATDIVAVKVNMEHSFIGDLQFTLICPSGNQTILKTYHMNGGAYMGVPYGGANHGNFDCTNPPACMSDPAQNPAGEGWNYSWTYISPQFGIMENYVNGAQMDSGSYTPDNPWTNMIGCPLNGTWNLQICDYWGIDNGWCFSWELQLDASILPTNWGYTVPIDTMFWSGPYIIQNTPNLLTIHPDTGGVFPYDFFIADDFGCTWDTTIMVNVVPTPEVNLGSDTAQCEGTAITITAPTYPLATYYWLPNGDTTQTIDITESNDYVAIIQTGNGNVMCIGQDTINVSFSPRPLINFLPDTMNGCQPVKIHFQNGSLPTTANFEWDFGDGGTSTAYEPDHTYTSEGFYSVTLKAMTGAGCEDTYTASNIIQVFPQPKAAFTPDPMNVSVQNPTVSFINQSVNGVDPHWYFGDGDSSTEQNPLHTFPTVGVYNVWLFFENSFGCADSALRNVNVIDDSIFVPNVITPNGSPGKNDLFEVYNIGAFLTNELLVFDRWGKKVFEKLNYKNDWNGGDLPDGTYFIILRGHGLLRNFEYKGTLTILRE